MKVTAEQFTQYFADLKNRKVSQAETATVNAEIEAISMAFSTPSGQELATLVKEEAQANGGLGIILGIIQPDQDSKDAFLTQAVLTVGISLGLDLAERLSGQVTGDPAPETAAAFSPRVRRTGTLTR